MTPCMAFTRFLLDIVLDFFSIKGLGMFMDDEQVEEFDKAVEVLKKKVESYDH